MVLVITGDWYPIGVEASAGEDDLRSLYDSDCCDLRKAQQIAAQRGFFYEDIVNESVVA